MYHSSRVIHVLWSELLLFLFIRMSIVFSERRVRMCVSVYVCVCVCVCDVSLAELSRNIQT